MLTMAEIQDELRDTRFMPGWTITAYEGRWEGHHVVVRAVLHDATTPEEDVTLDVHSALPPIPDVAYLHEWLLWRLGRVWSHEVREWYRVRGRLVSDPHADGAEHDRGLLTDATTTTSAPTDAPPASDQPSRADCDGDVSGGWRWHGPARAVVELTAAARAVVRESYVLDAHLTMHTVSSDALRRLRDALDAMRDLG
jgi:hypothetical protein